MNICGELWEEATNAIPNNPSLQTRFDHAVMIHVKEVKSTGLITTHICYKKSFTKQTDGVERQQEINNGEYVPAAVVMSTG